VQKRKRNHAAISAWFSTSRRAAELQFLINDRMLYGLFGRADHSAAAARHPSMIVRISARQEPQLVPAFSSLPTASTL
jgi:hypothetical protein